MKKQFIKKFIASFVGVISCAAMAVPVLAAPKITTTGGVSIDLKTYTGTEDKRVEAETFDELYPGEVRNYYINVINQAFPAYVRVKVVYDSTFEIENPDSMLGGISEDWVKKDGYFYYTKALEQNTNIDLCKTFKVPDISEGINNQIRLSIKADAIQSQNFTPDFESDDPWKGQKIEATKAIGEIYTDERSYPVNHDNYTNVADKNVFKIKGNPMPGDKFTDKIVATPLVNGTMNFKVIYNDKNFPEEAALIKLIIKNGNTKLYEGSLFSSQLEYGVDIKNVQKGHKYTFNLEMQLDTKLVNVSEWTELPVTFFISTYEVQDPIIIINEGDSVINNYITEPAGVLGATLADIPQQGVLGAIRNNILTGDNAMPVVWFLIGVMTIAAGITIGTVQYFKKRRDNDEA